MHRRKTLYADLRLNALGLALRALFAAPATATPAAVPMQTVVVTASGFEQAMREAPASITVLTRDKLGLKRFGNLTQALESVEGIDVGAAADKTGGRNISIRGPMSTLYGSDAMGGVITIITRQVGSKWSASLAAEYTA